MDLTFKAKTSGLSPDNITSSLCEFLITYPQYIEVSFSILCRKNTVDKNIKTRIEISPEIDTVDDDENLNAYYNLIGSFYDTTNSNLNLRRGKLLELLVSNIKPINTCGEFKIILESLVEYKGTKISDKDIDVVFKYDGIELIECKSNLSSFLCPPDRIYKKNKAKLDFMEEVRRLANKSSVNCYLFFATYGQDIEYCKRTLRRNGYNFFDIINRDIIIDSLC